MRGEQRVVARFPCGADHVITQWQLDETVWRLRGITLPDLVPKSLDIGVAAFRRAWEGSGTDGLMAMIRDEDQAKVGGGIKRILAKRDWLDKRPALGEVDPGRVSGSARSYVLFEIEDDELRVTLQYWHPSWRIVGFKPPSR